MDRGDKFYAFMWTIVGTVALAIVLTVAGVTINTTDKIAEMVKNGANPLDARCAYSSSVDQICTLRATK